VLGADFTVTVSDLQFILQQIRIAESHRALETNPVADASVVPSTNVLTAGRALTDAGTSVVRQNGRNVTVPTVTVTAASESVEMVPMVVAVTVAVTSAKVPGESRVKLVAKPV
jgi:hypothetical protein